MTSQPSWKDIQLEKITPTHPLITEFENLFVISDTHFHHTRLTAVLRPGSRPDNFTELLFERWRETVSENDIVLHLGDVTVGTLAPAEYNANTPKLPGRVYLLPGNHDRSFSKLTAYQERGWVIIEPFFHLWHDFVVAFTHEPLKDNDLAGIDLNVHGHTHGLLLDRAQYLNCCVEHLDLRPTPLLGLLQDWEQNHRPRN